jgi:predicted component of type VI protein secretion system
MPRVALPALALACSLAGPALALPFIGGGGKVAITIVASADCNNCGSGTASSLKVRVFQVADEGAIRTVLNNKGLGWGKQVEAAAANVLGKPAEDFVTPGTTKVITLAKDGKAKAIVIEGNFCKKTGADWYFIQPAKKKAPKLTAGATGFTIKTGK